MLIGLIVLIIIAISCAVIPWILGMVQITIPQYILDMLGGFIGSSFALIGSVSFQLISEKRKNKEKYEKDLMLLKREIYNNFIVCLHRISNDNSNIEVFDHAYNNFIIADDVLIKDNSNLYSEISNLYFIITRGEKTLKTANAFIDEILNLQKKQIKDFEDVKDIIQSTGIDYIYEFAIIRYTIHLNKNNNLNINLPFHDYEKLINYEQKDEADIEERILLYLSELVCKKIYNNDRVLFYRQHFHAKECC